MTVNDIESIFTRLGAVFCTHSETLATKLISVKAFVFDWDGVFNNASKNENLSSTFNEADSMGTNMLRFNHYLHHHVLPPIAIISGEKNNMAFHYAKREHYNACYYKVADKIVALEHFCAINKLQKSEICYVFDDVLDLSIAGVCGVRILISRKASPLFTNYVVQHGLADYITASESGNFAVREACELMIGLNGTYNKCIDERKGRYHINSRSTQKQ